MYFLGSGAGSPRSRCRQGWALLWPLSLALQWNLLAVASQGCPSVCVPLVSLPFYQDTSYIGLGPVHMALFNFNYLFKGPAIKYSLNLRYEGL